MNASFSVGLAIFVWIHFHAFDRIDPLKTTIKIQLAILLLACAGIVAGTSCAKPKTAQPLAGSIDSSSAWNCGWIDLKQPLDFHAGDRLEIKVGGTAKKVILRLLPVGAPRGSIIGIVGGSLDVPPGRVLDYTLSVDRLRTTMISVHGGVYPWTKYELGVGNGPATIESVSVVPKQ